MNMFSSRHESLPIRGVLIEHSIIIHPENSWRFTALNLCSLLPTNWCIFTSSTAQGGGGSFKNRKPIGEVGCCESGMAERSHWWSERWLISLTISLSFSDYLPTYLPTYLSIYLSLSSNYLSIYLSVYLSVYLSIYLSFLHLSSCLPVYLWCNVIECNVV